MDCLIPVPLHYRRQFLRGYNQSNQLARMLGRHLNIAVDNRLVKRRIHTAPQFGLDTKGRIKNIQNAFLVKHQGEYQSVAIIDDIITTGSTVNELSRVLRGCGIKHVSAWVLAHADRCV